MARGVAIHIGLNHVDDVSYGGWKGALRGAERDARGLASITRAAGFEITELLGKKATATHVVDSLSKWTSGAGAPEYVVITYAGHGGLYPDPIREYPDGQCKTWCLYDRQFFARELYWYLGKMHSATRIVLITDCCWSGTVMRALPSSIVAPVQRVRFCPQPVTARYSRSVPMAPDVTKLIKKARTKEAIAAPCVVIAGALENQIAYEGASGGLFTTALRTAWNGGVFVGNYKDLLFSVKTRMPTSQTPMMLAFGRKKKDIDRLIHARPFSL